MPTVLTTPYLTDGNAPLATFSDGTIFQQPERPALQLEERRLKTRYAIELDVRFSMTRLKSRVLTIGRTINMSSNGLLVASAAGVKIGAELELMIKWPWSLDGKVPLQLAATAVVVRSTPSNFAVALRSYQFKTMKQRPALQATA